MKLHDTSDERPSFKVRPVHVEFWRCGRASPSRHRGWARCLTWELCKYHGCQKMQAEELRAATPHNHTYRFRERWGGWRRWSKWKKGRPGHDTQVMLDHGWRVTFQLGEYRIEWRHADDR